jgi:TolB-like protein/Tfp pilus assembly protein PilF
MPGQRFTFGPFLLDPDRRTLFRQGEPVAVGQRGIRLLTTLIRHAGDVLSKDELLDAAWSGMSVEESNLSVQVAALRRLLGPSPDGGEWIATIPRIGYRFVGGVDALESTGRSSVDFAPLGSSRREPSIAVLPFANLSDDSEQEYFADGLTEDIITGLSCLRWLRVCTRNSSFTYKSMAANAAQVAQELGVSYVVTGSVRRFGSRVRIGAQLIDASTASQIWAERYDRNLFDFFALQDQITESVVASIEPYLFAAEGSGTKRKTPESLDAWGFVMRAMPHIWTWAADDNETAIAYLKQATKIDPGYARANSLLAWMYAARLNIGWSPLTESREQALSFARLAVEQDGQDAWARLALGYIHSMSRRFAPAVEELTVSIALNPSFAFAHAMLGMAYAYAGASDQGLQHVSLALRLSPRDPQQAPYLSALGLCHFMARRFAVAADLQRRCVQLRPFFGSAWRTWAAASGLCGDRQTAAAALAEAKRLQPELSIAWVEQNHPIVLEKDRAVYIDGLRLAGLE